MPVSPIPAASAALERELTGDLPCVVCGYNLRGISIRSSCPECGAAVRATILAVVDPLATELRPMRNPTLVTGGLVMWSCAALAAALLCWTPQLADLWSAVMSESRRGGGAMSPDIARAVLVCILLSGLGGVVLIHPHRGLRPGGVAAAAVGIAAYAPLAMVVWWIHTGTPARAAAYASGWSPDPTRSLLRLAMAALIVVIALALRPNARVLVARSLALRSGRVDRQTILAMVFAALVAAAGDVLSLLAAASGNAGSGGGGAGMAELLRLGAIVLIATGSALFTLGLAGALIDCWRISRAILRPGPSMHEIVSGTAAPGAPGAIAAPVPRPPAP